MFPPHRSADIVIRPDPRARALDATPRLLETRAADGASVRVQLHPADHGEEALYWLPALGVGMGPNERFAARLAAAGVSVAIHEWRGLGGSDRRAGRGSDWGYRELLQLDLAAGFAAAQAALPGARWDLGGHSLGGQLALLAAAGQTVTTAEGVLLVASGHPHWRAFPGVRALGVWLFAAALPALTRLIGHFPGHRLGFAGREAGRLMREWGRTARRGDYALPSLGESPGPMLAAHPGPVLALRMVEDWLAPAGALRRLRALAASAHWQEVSLGRGDFATRRPDHFGWLREPEAVVRHYRAWRSTRRSARADGATALPVDPD